MYFSPKTSADGLVFHYDTGNTVRSYLGEPTVNLTTDTPSLSGWMGGYTVEDNNTKTFLLTTRQDNAATTSAWRTTYWSVSAYIGSYVTISAEVEFVSETNCTFSSIAIGQGNTGSFPLHIEGSNALDKVSVYTKPVNRIHMTWSGIINATGIVGFTQWINNVTANGANSVLRVVNVQIEAKSHPTPFIAGTRSTTQGLKDLTGNRTVELANVSFNSSAQPEFDGSNDLITFGGSANIVNKSYTIEAVFNRYSTNRVDGIIGDLQYHWFSFYVTSNNEIYFFHRRNSPYIENGAISATGVVGTGYYHAVGVFDINAGMRVYLNGNLVASNSNTTAFDLSGRGPQYIGQHRGGAPSSPTVMSGQIPALKIYEGKALTADEVARNYNAIKSRFNIG